MSVPSKPLAWTVWALCVIVGAFFVLWTPVWTLPLEDGSPLWIWRVGCLQTVRIALIVLLVALPVLFVALLLAARRAGGPVPGGALAPLVGLPVVGAVLLAADWLPLGVAANFRFFYPALLGAWSLARLWPEAGAREGPADRPRYGLALLLLPVAVLYTWTCYHAAKTVGPSPGDECCYIIMAESLYTDHTLDTKIAWARDQRRDPDRLNKRAYMHLADSPRDGHWYSYHPIGLPLLLVPFWPLDPAQKLSRSVGMGLIAAAGCAGLWLLCRRVGASRRATALATGLVCGSLLWVSYASRMLTDLPGAVLLIWLFWAMAAEKAWPWRTVFVASLMTVYCAFMHLRTLPLGLLGAGFFGLAVLFRPGLWWGKILRLTVFSVIVIAGLGLWAAIQRHLYTGLAQPVGDVLFSYPRGIWAIFVDRMGIGAGFLPVYALLAAQVVWWGKDREQILLKVALATTFVACAVLNCSNIVSFFTMWDYVPGRYLVAVVPLLAPGLAVVLTGAARPAAALTLFLGLSGVALTAVYFAFLPDCGVMGHPLLHLTRLWAWSGFFMPFASYVEDSSAAARQATVVFAAAAVIVSYVLLRLRNGVLVPILCVVAVTVAAAWAHYAQSVDRTVGPTRVADVLEQLDRRYVLLDRPEGYTPGSWADLMRNRLYAARSAEKPLSVTTSDFGVARTNDVLSMPRLARNDWQGRELSWAELVPPFHSRSGAWLLTVQGGVSGRVERVTLAVRQGEETRWEGPLPTNATNWPVAIDVQRRRGDVSVWARVEGEGEWNITSIQWLPWNRTWSQSALPTVMNRP